MALRTTSSPDAVTQNRVIRLVIRNQNRHRSIRWPDHPGHKVSRYHTRRTERALEYSGDKPFLVYGCAYTAIFLAYSLRPSQCKDSRLKDFEVRGVIALFPAARAGNGKGDC